jgi:hypothetical protein
VEKWCSVEDLEANVSRGVLTAVRLAGRHPYVYKCKYVLESRARWSLSAGFVF